MRSSNDFWSFLISWRAVRRFSFREGSLVFTVLVDLSLNSFRGHFLAAVGNLGPATGGGVPEIKTVSMLTCGVETTGVSSAGTAFSSWMRSSWLHSSGTASVVELTVASMLWGSSLGISGRGKSSVIPSSNGLLGGLWRIGSGLGLPICGPSGTGTSSSCRVSPIIASGGGEPGGVFALADASHSWLRCSTKLSTSGEEGSNGDKSCQSPGASSLSEGFRLVNFPIFTLRVPLTALLHSRIPFENFALGRPVQLLRSVCLIFMPIRKLHILETDNPLTFEKLFCYKSTKFMQESTNQNTYWLSRQRSFKIQNFNNVQICLYWRGAKIQLALFLVKTSCFIVSKHCCITVLTNRRAVKFLFRFPGQRAPPITGWAPFGGKLWVTVQTT